MAESPLDKLRRLSEEERRVSRGGRPGPPNPGSRVARGGIGAVVMAALLFIVTKGKLLLLFLATKGKLLLAAIKVGPLLTTFSSMGLSIWVYAGFYGLHLAIGVVVLILVHELGHGAAAKAMRLRVGAPVFIPFFGAAIALKEQPRSTWVGAVIGFGGPLFGMIGGAVVLMIAMAMEAGGTRDLFVVIAWFTFFINLFNLLPVFGLDGDHVSRCFRPWFWGPGAACLVLVLVVSMRSNARVNPFVVLILLVGVGRGLTKWWRSRSDRPGRAVDRLIQRPVYVEEDDVRGRQRFLAALAYFGIVAALTFLVSYADGLRPMM